MRKKLSDNGISKVGYKKNKPVQQRKRKSLPLMSIAENRIYLMCDEELNF